MYEASKLLFCQYRKIFTVIILAIFFNFNLANQTSAYTASMSVVGGQNGISLDIPYTSSGMQKNETKPENLSKLLIKSDSAAGWELHLEATDLVARGTTDQKLTLYTQPTQSWDWSIPYVANIWGICSPRSKGEYGDLIEYFFNQDKTYTAIKTGIPTEDDGFTYEFGVYTHTNGKSLGGNYQGNLTFSLIANEETTTNFVNGRTFNHALREATGETDSQILDNPETEISNTTKIKPFTFSNKAPENAIKTLKISTDNSELPAYLSTVKKDEYYYPTIWTTANRLILNEDSSYMFSGISTNINGMFDNWKNEEYRFIDFSKVKNFSHFFYKLNKNSSDSESVSRNLMNLIAHSDPTNLDSMYEESKIYSAYIKLNTSSPASTQAMFKKTKYSFTAEGNFLKNSSNLTSTFESSTTSFNYKDLDDFGINATTTKNMYKDASMESLDFSKSNFEKLTNTEGMYENFTQDYWSRDKFNLPTAKSPIKLTNMARMFANFKREIPLDLSAFNTENVTDMSYLFGSDIDQPSWKNRVNYVTKVTVGDGFITKNVTNMEGMFAGSKVSNTNILVNSFDTSKVKNMSHFLDTSRSSSQIILKDDFDTQNVTDMSYMFANHEPLEKLVLGNNFNTQNVTNMEGMFSNNDDLLHLNLGNKFDTRNVTNMKAMFKQMWDLEGLNLEDKFDTSKVTDMSYMFDYSDDLVTLNIGDKFDTHSVVNMEYMFASTPYLKAIDFKGKLDTHKVTNMDHMFYASGIKTLDLGMNFNTSVVTSMASMFESSAVKDLTFPVDMGDAPNLTNAVNMFKNCSYLNLINPLNLDTKNITDMSSMFEATSWNYDQAEYNLGDKFRFDNVTTTEKMFYKNGGKKITFTHFNAPKNTTGANMFAESHALEISIPEFNLPEVTDLSHMFEKALVRKISLPSEVHTGKLENVYRMFYLAEYLESISPINLDTHGVTSMEDMFRSVSSSRTGLLEITLGPQFSLSKVTKTNAMFYGSRPKKISFSSFNAPELTDMEYMFASSAVQEIDLSNNIYTPKLNNITKLFSNDVYLSKISEINFNTDNITSMREIFFQAGAERKEAEFNFGSQFSFNKTTETYRMFGEAGAKKIKFANFNAPELTSMERMFEKAKIKEVSFPNNTNTPKLTNIYGIFSNSVDFDENYVMHLPFTTEKLENMGYAFYGFTGETVDLSSFDTRSLTTMAYAFRDSKIKNLDFSNKNLESMVDMTHTFSHCRKLQTINLSGTKTSNKLKKLEETFGSSTMDIVDLSGFDTSGVTTVIYLFETAPNIKTIYVSEKFIIDPSLPDKDMFEDDTKLVGGQGTTYNSSYMRKEYARIDDPSNGKPGYFTYKAAP